MIDTKSSTYLRNSGGSSPVRSGSGLACSKSAFVIASAGTSNPPGLEDAPKIITRLSVPTCSASVYEANIPACSARLPHLGKAVVTSVLDSKISEFLCLSSSANTPLAHALVSVQV